MKQKSSIFGEIQDSAFMLHALQQAQCAYEQGEVPIGALVVDKNGIIIGRGANAVERRNSQVAHAECIAIQKAGKKNGDWRLEGCWLYVTLEPCAMCMNLVLLSRIAGVVFGAQSPLFGYHLDNDIVLKLYKKKSPVIIPGICHDKSADILKHFFKDKR